LHLITILETVNHWAQTVISSLGYVGVGLMMFLENVFPPLPSEVILPLAGSLTVDKRFTLVGVTLVSALGSLAGALFFYGLGRWLGETRVRRLIERYGRWLSLSIADFDRATAWFERYGEPLIFFGRMVPMVRSLISIPAGLMGMSVARFNLYTALGTALWSLLLAWAGRILGQNWPLVSAWIGHYEHLVLAITVGAVVLLVTRRFLRRQTISVKIIAPR
jgi:membrane protein DedA with SNARE-associated domain